MRNGGLKKVAKAARIGAYVKAPRKAYRILHPIRSAKRAIFLRGLGTYVTPRNGARLGAILSVPLVLLVARKVRG